MTNVSPEAYYDALRNVLCELFGHEWHLGYWLNASTISEAGERLNEAMASRLLGETRADDRPDTRTHDPRANDHGDVIPRGPIPREDDRLGNLDRTEDVRPAAARIHTVPGRVEGYSPGIFLRSVARLTPRIPAAFN